MEYHVTYPEIGDGKNFSCCWPLHCEFAQVPKVHVCGSCKVVTLIEVSVPLTSKIRRPNGNYYAILDEIFCIRSAM